MRFPFHEKNRSFVCVIYFGWEPATVNPCETSMLGRTWNFRPCWWADWSMHWFRKCSGKPYINSIRADINWCQRFYLPSNFGYNLLVCFFFRRVVCLALGPWGLRASTFGAWVRQFAYRDLRAIYCSTSHTFMKRPKKGKSCPTQLQ